MRNIAYRRHQEQKHRAKAKRHFKERWNWTPPNGIEEPNHIQVCIHATTPKGCSCYMCGNPRKYFNEKPVQEQKADLDAQQQMEGWQSGNAADC